MININKGIKQKPYRLLIYGSSGIGKSSLANLADKPFFINLEDGLNMIDCDSSDKITNMKMFLDHITWFKESDYKTLIIDTLDIFEQILHKHICQEHSCDSIEKVGGGFGKGYTIAQEKWLKILDLLDASHKNYILIAHEQIKSILDPVTETFDKYIIKMNQKSASLITGRVDAVLFIKDETFVNNEKGKITGRYIYTKDKGSFIAKNRYNLPEKIDFGTLDKGQKLFDLINATMKGVK